MSGVEPPPNTPVAEDAAPPPAPQDTAGKHHSPWLWVSLALAVVAIGLLVWALSTRSDLNAAEDQNAQSQAKKAQADSAAAKAETKAAQSKAAVVTECARAYASALGGLFEGDGPKAQAPAVRRQLEAVTADCKAAFGSS